MQLISVLAALLPLTISIPVEDLDENGYPLWFPISSYACSGCMAFENNYKSGQKEYEFWYNANDKRELYWTGSKWTCYKPQNNYHWGSCSESDLFKCPWIRWTVNVPGATGSYQYAQLYNGRYAYKRTDSAFYVYYDTATALWKLSDALGGTAEYAICGKHNFFECSWVSTGSCENKCCTVKSGVRRESWLATCTSWSESEAQCGAFGNDKCEWVNCVDIGYCTVNQDPTYEDKRPKRLCGLQTNQDDCEALSFNGKQGQMSPIKNCVWTLGSPTQEWFDVMDEYYDELGIVKEEQSFLFSYFGMGYSADSQYQIDIAILLVVLFFITISLWYICRHSKLKKQTADANAPLLKDYGAI